MKTVWNWIQALSGAVSVDERLFAIEVFSVLLVPNA